MKKYKNNFGFTILILFTMASCGQNDSQPKELELKERELSLREKELKLKEKEDSLYSIANANLISPKKSEESKQENNATNKNDSKDVQEKNLTLIFKSYSCGDGCYWEFIDAKTKERVAIAEWDDNNKNYQVAMEEIAAKCEDRSCYLQGKRYMVTQKYKLVDEMEYGDGEFVKTGKKNWKWVVTSLKRE